MTSNTSPSPGVPDLEEAKLLLDVWKFRQHHCWNILERYGLAASLVSIAPYLWPHLPAELGIKILVFPVFGWLIAIWAVWLFGAEYTQCNPIAKMFRQKMGPHYPSDWVVSGWRHVFIRLKHLGR